MAGRHPGVFTQRRRADANRYRLRMFWPLIGGFVALVLLTVLIGWLVDPARSRDASTAEPQRPPHPHP